MTREQYYTTPPQELFDEIKSKAIELWQSYDDTYGYATEKINIINKINNYKDNIWTIVCMFDEFNQLRLADMVSEEVRLIILDVMKGVR